MIKIRGETQQDFASVAALITRAFGRSDEARLVDQLRADGEAVISLIAEQSCVPTGHMLVGQMLAGHIMLSRMAAPFAALGLAPLAVDPAAQRRGIGAALVAEAIARARSEGSAAIFVLGDERYYGRFGFKPEHAAGFSSPYAGPHFMALPLVSPLPTQTGAVQYAPAFSGLG